ncbi:hypothetical protein [Ehrlichia muris]|uniref:Uncharacterized protein n=1 Tax=Ehrlichia muris AS145 TaxID=1423892 RepID=V9R5R5_9RICK|nr:hypothetical protein [Ehrlichia muris]AHC39092.1 hypothetical protein EMUR_01400 [Ehrlichia muris AS145]
MFYPTRDLKTIYSKDNTVCVDHIIECMNGTAEQIQTYSNNLLHEYIEQTKQKLNNQRKNPEDIQAHISSESFYHEASSHVEYMLTQYIIDHLSDNNYIGHNKTKILTDCTKRLEHIRKSMIMQGVYKLSLLAEFNKLMQDISDEEFKELTETIIACSHLKTDLTEQQQKSLEGAIQAYNHEQQGFSLESIRNFAEDLTGIDILNPMSSIKKKLGLNKPADTKQPLGSMDEKLVNAVMSPHSCYYFILGTLTFGLGGLAGPLLPLLIITTVGKSLYGMVTEDKGKEGTIHNPFQEGVTRQPRITEKPYTTILEQRKKEASEQHDIEKPQTSRQL